MSNRAQRRAAYKAKPKWQKLSKDQKINALLKNGITPEDLKRSYTDGYDHGREDGINGTYQTAFAAVCLALNEVNGFDAEACCLVLEKAQEHIINTFSSPEAVQKVYKQLGLTLDFGDPISWVQMEE